MRSDKELLDWLEQQQGSGLVSDDDKHWCVASDGLQNVPLETPADIDAVFWIKAEQWKLSVRDAINSAMDEAESEAPQ